MNTPRIAFATAISLLLSGGCFDKPVTATLDGTGSSSGTTGATGTTGTTGGQTSTLDGGSTSGSSGMEADDESGPPDEDPPARSTVIVQTAGGGRASSASFSARLYVGAPQPAGRTASMQYRAHLGPGSVR